MRGPWNNISAVSSFVTANIASLDWFKLRTLNACSRHLTCGMLTLCRPPLSPANAWLKLIARQSLIPPSNVAIELLWALSVTSCK